NSVPNISPTFWSRPSRAGSATDPGSFGAGAWSVPPGGRYLRSLLADRSMPWSLDGFRSEIRGHLRRQVGRLDRRAFRQLEHAFGQRVEEGQHLVGLHHVGILGVHVAQVDRVARLRSVEAAFLGERDTVIQAERVEHGRSHAT